MADSTAYHGTPAVADEEARDDLQRRLSATRLVRGVEGASWQHGSDRGYLADVLRSWREFDWRATKERIAALPWTRTSNDINLIHQRADDPDAPAAVLLHGWPDSFLRFQKVLTLLTDVHIVVPCLPGFPYSGSAGADQPTMAGRLGEAMAELGYPRYAVSGGDIGAQVAEAWARALPEHVGAVHLTDIPYRHIFEFDAAELSQPEREFANRMLQWRRTEGGYQSEQSTKPNTLAVALGDSPAGLAAWIIEKLRAWSDCDGDVESVFGRDDLLTWLSVYWFTGSIGTSFSPYALHPALESTRVDVPTAVTAFPREPLGGPREFAERLFDVQVWDQPAAGGHFGAWEQPDVFASGIRAAVELLT